MFERHVDLDGRMAGNRSRNASANLVEVQGLVFVRKLVEQLVQHVLHLARFEAGRGNLDGNAAGAKGLCLNAIFQPCSVPSKEGYDGNRAFSKCAEE